MEQLLQLLCGISFLILSLGSFVTGYTYFRSKNGELRIIMYKKFWCCAFAFFWVAISILTQPFGLWIIMITAPFIPYAIMKFKLFKYITKN